MMGRQPGGQERLFYTFHLEDHVPANHLLRRINRCIDFSGLHQHLSEHYSQIGRPSIDPELMMRMLVVGYCYGIRSERRLCEELHLNLAGLLHGPAVAAPMQHQAWLFRQAEQPE